MSELDFEELVRQLCGLSLPFQGLKWKQIVDFVTFALRLKNPILLAQPAGVSVTEAPDVLPPSVAAFLGGSCNLTPSAVEHCWKILKTTIWTYTESDVEAAFAEHGVKHSLSMHHYYTSFTSHYLVLSASHTFYPPEHICQNVRYRWQIHRCPYHEHQCFFRSPIAI
jgi:hypothetical protein